MSDKRNIDTNILGETAKITWKELQLFFAGGKAIYVSNELDLVDVATQIANDNKKAVDAWMKNKQIMLVPDNKAKAWYEHDATLWAVVIKPWVLVQELKNPDSQVY